MSDEDDQETEPSLGLVICTNTNICGKAHFGMDQQGTNTGKGAYGYAFRAIECLRVLGPPNLDVYPGTCFIRCNKGVNAKLMVREDDDTAQGGARSSNSANGKTVRVRDRFLKDGCPYWRLNSIDLCVGWLDEALNVAPDERRLAAYRSYAEACTLLGDTINGKVRGDLQYNLAPSTAALSSGEAATALPLLDDCAEHVLSLPPPPEGWPPSPISQRGTGFAGTWQESFYDSKLHLEVVRDDEKDGMLLRGTYTNSGGRPCQILARQSGTQLLGSWSEEGAAGELRLSISSDGLSFSGSALCGESGEKYEWRAERLPEEGMALGGTASQRWQSRVLCLRSRARLVLGRGEDALSDAAFAVRICPWLPLAWEVGSEAAMAMQDKRTAARARQEWLFLQPSGSTGLPASLAAARRRQRLTMDEIERGGTASAASSSPLALYLMLGDIAVVKGEFSERDPLQGQYEALFAQGEGGEDGEDDEGVAEGAATSSGAEDKPDAEEEEARSKLAASIFVDKYAIDGE